MAGAIICAKFGVEKLRGYRYTVVQTLVSPIETAAACDLPRPGLVF